MNEGEGLLGIEVRNGLRIEQNKSSRAECSWSIVNVTVLLGPSFVGKSAVVISPERCFSRKSKEPASCLRPFELHQPQTRLYDAEESI